MKLFSRSKKSSRASAYARPRWIDVSQVDTGDKANQLEVKMSDLEKRGCITRDTLEGTVAREFSLIKRRLFRRLDYFKHSKNGQRKGQDERCPVVLTTSSKPGEGKTFSACNLALSLALEEQVNVLLIDSDLAKPSVPEIFGYPGDLRGLFECLSVPNLKVWDCIRPVARMRLAILPAGQATSSPAPLLGGERMLELLDELSHGPRAFDFIVMDGPPLLATTEASVLAQHADEIMLVIGAGEVSVNDIQSSLEMLNAEEKVNLMINLMPFGEPLPTDYAYSYRAA